MGTAGAVPPRARQYASAQLDARRRPSCTAWTVLVGVRQPVLPRTRLPHDVPLVRPRVCVAAAEGVLMLTRSCAFMLIAVILGGAGAAAADQVIKTVPVGSEPLFSVSTPDGSHVYVGNR